MVGQKWMFGEFGLLNEVCHGVIYLQSIKNGCYSQTIETESDSAINAVRKELI